MSQTAAQINQEIRDRLNRGSEISETQVYDWMNRAKKRCQLQGAPMDFMLHEQIALMGGGTGICDVPEAQLRFNAESLVLPPSFHTMVSAKIYTGEVFGADEVTLIYGDQHATPLFYYPSTCTAGTGLSTDHVGGEEDLYPLFAADDSSIDEDLDDRGITLTFEDIAATKVKCRLASNIAMPFLPEPVDESGPVIRWDMDAYAENPRRSAVSTAASNAGYALTEWPAKVLTIANYDDYFGVTSGMPDYRFIHMLYYRTLPDYNTRSLESLLAPVPAEDIFTRTGEDLLITGALRLAYRYINDFPNAEKYEGFERQEAREFRRQHRSAQTLANYESLQRVREGTRIVRAY